MAAKNPRINMVLEKPLYKAVRDLAKHEGVSISQKARDLVRDALELLEDIGLDAMAEERMRTFNKKTAITHAEMRRRVGL